MDRDWLSIISSIRRTQLGEEIPILIFRAFRIFSGEYLRDVIGDRGAIVLFQNAGRELGRSLGDKLRSDSVESYLDNVGAFMKENKIGILIPERLEENEGILKIDECITCSGMPNVGMRICHFESGLVAGLFESFLGSKVRATETRCNAMGEGVCEVRVEF